MAYAEVRLVELVRDVEPEALELSSLQEDGVEPREREQQLAVAEGLPASTELFLSSPNAKQNKRGVRWVRKGVTPPDVPLRDFAAGHHTLAGVIAYEFYSLTHYMSNPSIVR